MKKKFLFGLFALLTSISFAFATPIPTQAAGTPLCASSSNPLAITRPCENITQEELDCHDKTTPGSGADCISNYVKKFALNIGQMIGDIGAYVAVALAMFGGFLYMTSAGDPGKAAKGRKTIINSCIGIVITKVSSLALKTVSDFMSRIGSDKSIGNIASEVAGEMLFWGGAICVIMIMWGGFQYTTSAGDPGKAAKARQTLLYAVVGLVLMIVAAVIINFAVSTFK